MKSFSTVISSKGQVVIPARLREQFGLAQGTRAYWIEEEGRLVLSPITTQNIDRLMGCLKPKPGEESLFEASFIERERERAREKE